MSTLVADDYRQLLDRIKDSLWNVTGPFTSEQQVNFAIGGGSGSAGPEEAVKSASSRNVTFPVVYIVYKDSDIMNGPSDCKLQEDVNLEIWWGCRMRGEGNLFDDNKNRFGSFAIQAWLLNQLYDRPNSLWVDGWHMAEIRKSEWIKTEDPNLVIGKMDLRVRRIHDISEV